MRSMVALLLLAGLAGCSDDPSPDPAADGDPEPAPTPWDEGDRIALYQNQPGDRLVAVQVCDQATAPEPYPLARNGALVPNGTASISVAVTNEDPAVGFQVGSRVDGGPVSWLDPVADGQAEFSIPVDPSQVEDNATGQRWEFVYRYAPAGQGQDCYTGPILASHPLLIEAVRGGQAQQAPMG